VCDNNKEDTVSFNILPLLLLPQEECVLDTGPVTVILSCIIFHTLNKLSLSLLSAKHMLSLAFTLSPPHI